MIGKERCYNNAAKQELLPNSSAYDKQDSDLSRPLSKERDTK